MNLLMMLLLMMNFFLVVHFLLMMLLLVVFLLVMHVLVVLVGVVSRDVFRQLVAVVVGHTVLLKHCSFVIIQHAHTNHQPMVSLRTKLCALDVTCVPVSVWARQ